MPMSIACRAAFGPSLQSLRAVSGSFEQKSGRRGFYLTNDDSCDRQPRILAQRQDLPLKQEKTAVGLLATRLSSDE